MENTKRNEDQKFTQMTETPVEKLVLKLAGPSIVIMMITALYNMADTFFVGHLGNSATGAVGIVFSVMSLIQAFGFFFGHGSGNYISRQLGAQNHEEAVRMASTGFFTAILLVSALAVLGLLFIEPFAVLLGATATILPHAVSYLRFILIGAPFMAGSLMLNNMLRFQGSSFWGMIGMTTGAALNIALDPLLIFVFKMDVAGAGCATMISQMVSCALLYIVSRRPGNIPVKPRNFSPTLHRYREMIRGGLPSLFRQGLGSLAFACLNRAAGPYGDAAIAALTIVNRVIMFATSALLGFGQGFQPVCGFNYGAARYDRVRRAYWFCVRFTLPFLIVFTVVGFVFSPQIIAGFRDDAAVLAVGVLTLRLQCLVFPFMGFMLVGNMMMQTIGESGKATLLASARQGLFFLPLLFLLSGLFGLRGIQCAQPVADLCSILLSVPLIFATLRGMTRREQQGIDAPPPRAPSDIPME